MAGEPFALNLEGVDRKINLWATASGHELLVNWGEGRLELEVAGAALELTATATIVERNLQVAAGGLLQGTPVSATAGVKLADLSGDLLVGYGDAELTGQLSSEADRFTMDLQLLAPNGGPLPLPVEASLRLEIGAEGVRLTKLRARSNGVWGLDAEGVLSPELALSGRLDHPLEGFGPVELSGYREDSSLVISLAIDDLQGELKVSDGIRLAEAKLGGVLSLPRYGDSIESFLSWTPKGGFAGRATAQLTPAPGWAVALEVTGRGGLDVAIEVGGTSGPLARADAVLSERPWSDPSLTGRVELDLDAASLLGLPEGVALRLTGNPTLSGRLDSPEVAGDFQLDGILAATGYGLFDLAGGRIDLSGPGTSVTATATRSGWEARLDLEGLDIAAPFPAVREPRLDLQTQLSATWGGDPEGSVTRLILQTPNGRVSGRGRFDDDLEVSLDLDAGLEDLLLPGLPLQGRVRGPLVVRGPLHDGLREAELTGSLEVERAAIGRVAASLSGSLLVEGRVGDPGVQIDLSGEGAASGSVAGSIRPVSGRVDLVSDLSFGSVATDLAIVSDEGAVRVHGGVDLGVGGFQTAPGSQEGNLFLGEGLFTGWRVEIRSAPLEAHITGDLEPLTGSVAGRFDLRLSPPKAAGIWLEGGFEGVSLAGLDLGSAAFSATTAGAEISGDRLAGSLRLADLAWSLERLELDLPGPFLLGAAGSGRAAEGTLEALVTGPNGETELPIEIRLDRDQLELGGRGRLLNGEVSLDLTASAGLGWSGGVDLAGLRLAGGVLSASGRMSGALTLPELAGDLSWIRGPFDLRGSATAGLDRVTFDQRLSGPDLDPLTLTGELWPQSRLTLSGQGPDRLVLEASQLSPAATVMAAGRLEFGFGPVDTLLAASAAGGLGIRISSAALEGLAAETLIPSGTLEQLLSGWQESGLPFRGTGRAAGGGSLQLGPEPKLRLDEFSYRGSGLAGTLSGTMRLGTELGRDLGGELSGVVELSPSIPWLPEVITDTPLHLHLSATPGSLTLDLTSSLGPLELRHEMASGSGSLLADLAWPGGSFEADAEYGPAARAGGVVRIRGLTWREAGPAPPLSLDADIEVDSEALEGTVTVAAGGGTVRITGRWGVEAWGAEAFALTTSAERRLDLRVAGVEPGRLPIIERITPNLGGKVNGVVQVRGNLYVGQLVAPTLSVLGTEFPAQVEFDGNPRSLTARGSIDQSTFTLTLNPEGLTVVARLERFPGEVAAKAVVGSVDVAAEITGLLRFTLPWGRDEPGELRLATERVRLERDGVVTEGNLSLSLFDGALTVDRAAFEGAGRWRAAGRVTPDQLEFQLLAEEADFTPLLGLVPQFAALGIGARGSLELRAGGTLGRPTVRASSSSLELTAAGVLYRLNSGELELEGDRLRLAGELEGIDRLTGNLSLSGTGVLTLDPLLLERLEVALTGEVTAPVLGSVEALEGRIIGAAGQGLRVEAAGLLGNPVWIEGSLSPLDLRLHGLELELSAPDFLVASSRADLDLGIAFDRALRLSGSVTASQTRLSLSGRPPWASGRKPDPTWARIVFDDLRLSAPQRVAVNESYANLELGLEFTLAGTVAAPRLSGRARALRGSFQFAGSSFDILSAEASFDPPRLPQIRVAARTSFDKAQVLAASALDLEFVAPSGASRFDVDLAFEGEISASKTDDLPFVLDADPTLTSDAVIQETEGESPAVPRPLTEGELFSLITLGRLDLQSDLTGAEGIGPTVAETALDTVFDLLFLSGLQTALGEALGIEVVELRTTALSTILDESGGAPFGVSFRLGGYLSSDLSASYRIASYDDPDRLYALTNELRLTYGLGPFELDVVGRVNFEDISTLQPASELSVALRYTILGGTSLETGLDLGGERQQLYFGVSFGF
ncbi:MAG: translocation/assembly module TamB domain-containing protein [Truepera sp.]|nr:translocation/assembly module TamB domain-containing protein [Truepera sp.]